MKPIVSARRPSGPLAFEQCDIFDNAPPNADIRRFANPTFLACRIP
jgi:hypothetical protein